MPRILLGGDRPRFFDENGRPFTKPARLVFTDGSTSLPKSVYFSPTSGSGATIVDLVDNGYVPVSGIWLDVGTYNMALQLQVTADPEIWSTLWTLPSIPGGSSDATTDDTAIYFYDTVAQIRLATVKAGMCFNTGYYRLNDGGQGVWRWNSESLEDDDGGAYLLPIGQSNSVPGRWVRVMPSNGVVSIGMWGATVDVADASGNIRNACLWCARNSDQTGSTLEFPSGKVNIGTATLFIDDAGTRESSIETRKMSVVVRQAFEFNGTGVVTFDVPTVIESRSQIANDELDIVFTQNSGISSVDSSWGATVFRASRYAINSGIGLRFSKSWTATENVGSFGEQVPSIILSDSVSITFGLLTFACNTLIIEGRKRKALIFPASYTNPAIGNTLMFAWWFGYGIETYGDHTPLLSIADSVALVNNSTLQIDYNESPATVSTITLNSRCLIYGPLSIVSGATVIISELANDPKTKIFDLADNTCIARVGNNSLNPLWYGMTPVESSSINSSIWTAIAKSLYNWQWIDGCGLSYYVNPELYMPAFLRIKNMSFSLALSSDANIFNGTDVTLFMAQDCQFIGYGYDPLPTISIISSQINASISVDRCQSFGGITVGGSGIGSTVSVVNSKITKGFTSITNGQEGSASIIGNTCIDGKIYFNAGYTTCGNVVITGNRLKGSTQDNCDIQFWTNIPNTNIRNVVVSNNILEWTGTTEETILISHYEYGGGSFATWQDVHVGENTVVSSYTPPTEYPTIGTVSGPYVSATGGSNTVLFDQVTASSVVLNFSNAKAIRLGPLFLGRNHQNITFNSRDSAISGAFFCEQVDNINSDGATIESSEFSLLVPNANPLTDGHFFEALAQVRYQASSSLSGTTFWVRPRAIVTWGDRCDIGRYSKVY